MGLVGDSLVEPFGPEGLGISKGFLSVFDTAWMAKRFKKGSEDPWCSTTFRPTVEGGNKLTQTRRAVAIRVITTMVIPLPTRPSVNDKLSQNNYIYEPNLIKRL